MFGMDIDSPPPPLPMVISPGARIVQRLAQLGVPEECVNDQPSGLVAYVKNNNCQISEIVSAILPTDEDVSKAVSEAEAETTKSTVGPTTEELYTESMFWLRWLMFECDPDAALERLSDMNVGQRGVCGAVWGNNDIAYRCRTCEHDPTCAICVPCFRNGNHKDHDYSIIYTGGGCCDCGDVTAWKREGFCSMHKGAEQIQPLPKEFASSIGPVIDSLLSCWKRKLIFTEKICEETTKYDENLPELKKAAEDLTSAVVDMLLEFCKFSESLLSFISGRVFSLAGLLDILVKAERYLSSDVVKRLHELLLKLLGEPQFKYEFAKVFLSYYPTVVTEAAGKCNDNVLKKYPLLSTFSVQIFTVPTLTPRLVKEINLLAILMDCLGDIFISCSGDDGRLQVTRWANLYETTLRVVEDIRFVMSHSVVPMYVARDRRDISRTWMKLLAFVQGMNPQKRETGIHIEEENETTHLPFVLVHSIANIHSFLVGGAFSFDGNGDTEEEASSKTYQQEIEDQDSVRHAKVGRISQESSVSSMTGRNLLDHPLKFEVKSDNFPVPLSVLWLTYECLRAIESWLGVDDTKESALGFFSTKLCNHPVHNFFTLKRAVAKLRRGRYSFKSFNASSTGAKLSSSNEIPVKQCSSHVRCSSNSGVDLDAGLGGSDGGSEEGEYANELEALRVLSLSDWPDIVYDVSSQEISVHIPLHRLLSMLLQRSLRRCYGESTLPNMMSAASDDAPSAMNQDFFGQMLGGCHPYGFSAFVMEHPLRIRVFCAEVHAGMWRKNGDAAILSCEWYRSVRWSEQGLELDLFLLQCCAALAPPDLCVQRILERFGLSDFLSMNLERSSEYESILVQEMLILIIQIVKERRFSGLTTAECLQRELVYKLSLGDATRSQLVKSLPLELSKFDELQKILDMVAVYSNPSGMNQGMYKLRSEYWKELDLYHPRWNSRDLQVAEERYIRFCHTSALTSQLPRWSNIYHPLSGIARIATCKTVLQIIRAALYYSVFSEKSTASRAPDVVLLTALHLLSLSLDICCVHRGSGDRSCYVGDVIPILEFATEEFYTARHGDQSLLSLLVLLMRIHEREKVNNFIEASSFNLSSLIQTLIKKFAELEPGCTLKLQKLAPELVNQLTGSCSMVDTTSDSEVDKRKAKARERQAAILEKMRAQQSKFLESIDSSPENGLDDSEFGKEMCDSDIGHDSVDSTQVICSLCHDVNSKRPVSYLILLQRSKLLSFIDRGPPSWEQGFTLKKNYEATTKETNSVSSPKGSESCTSQLESQAQLLQSIQSAVEDFASEGQPAEVNAFLEYFGAHFPSLKNIPLTLNDNRERTTYSLDKVEELMYTLVREEMASKLLQKDFTEHGKDISIAGGIQERSSRIESLLLAKYIASISKETADDPSASVNSHSYSNNPQPDRSTSLPEYERFGPSDCDGIFLSSCGHAVHQGCLDRYLSSLRERYIRRIVFEGGHIVDPDQGEFLCPVCRGFANCVLPALPGEFKRFPGPPVYQCVTASDGVVASARSDVIVDDALRISEALCLLQSAADVARNDEILNSIPLQQSSRQGSNLESVIRVISSFYFPGKDKISESSRASPMLMLWDTLKYSLISTEIAARSGKTSLTPKYSLDSLHGELKTSSGFIISLLLNIVQTTRVKNSPSVLLRLRGIQLFADSICSGISSNEYSGYINQGGGKMQEILENLEPEIQYPDIQLWKQASDPILAQDAFSSLMWTLFCLPFPFLSCEDSFLCLVHIFYVVTITQAIITCCRKLLCGIDKLEYKDGIISDIYRFVGKYEISSQHFDSNYIECYGGIKEAIRGLSFPYLRRCALLWRLLNSTMSVPFNFGNHVADDMTEHTKNNLEEFVEVEKLEQIFKIPSLDAVVHDEVSRSVVSRWLHHFSEDLKVQNRHFVLYSTPVVPFRLMLLPNLYQDLLQRYIKQQCRDCGAVQEEPVLCLLCGKLCSPSWRTCCRESGCQTHAMVCGAGTGVFLLIRRTSILLQRSARQAPWPSPYLDAYGEEDNEMHRGKPLYLSEERYAALTQMVASHGLDRSSKVLRHTTIGAFFML